MPVMEGVTLRYDLAEDPHVTAIARQLGVDRFAVLGRLYSFWRLAELHGDGDQVRHLTCADVDEATSLPGFAAALEAVGWLEATDSGLRLPRYLGQSLPAASRPADDLADRPELPEDLDPAARAKALAAARARRHRQRVRQSGTVTRVTASVTHRDGERDASRHAGWVGGGGNVLLQEQEKNHHLPPDGASRVTLDPERDVTRHGDRDGGKGERDAHRLLEAFYERRGTLPVGRSDDFELAEAIAGELGIEAALAELPEVIREADKGLTRTGPALYFSVTRSWWTRRLERARRASQARDEARRQEAEAARRRAEQQQIEQDRQAASAAWRALDDAERDRWVSAVLAERPTLPRGLAEVAAMTRHHEQRGSRPSATSTHRGGIPP